MRNPSFTFYLEWREILHVFPAEVRFEVYDAVIEYEASGTLPGLKPMAKMAFAFIGKITDEEADKPCKLVRNRSEGGKKGMTRRYNSVNSSNSVNSVITQDYKEHPLKEISPTPPKENNPQEKEKPPKGGKKKNSPSPLELISKQKN